VAWLNVLLIFLRILADLSKLALGAGGIGVLVLMGACTVEFLTAPIGLKNTPWPEWAPIPPIVMIVAGLSLYALQKMISGLSSNVR
jgi:hypothetical protein